MSDTEKVINRSKELVASFNEKKRAEEAKRIFDLLPQGPGSGLDADTVDGLHAKQIIAKASGAGIVSSTGAVGMIQHGNEYHTPDMEEYGEIKGKTVDDSAIGDNKILVYDLAGDKLQYETQSGGGAPTDASYVTISAEAGLSNETLHENILEANKHTPKAHDLAGAEHNADTLADLNAKISDATLVDMPNTIANVLSDHTKTAHDALSIVAGDTEAIDGKTLDAATPSNGQVLIYDNATDTWKPLDPDVTIVDVNIPSQTTTLGVTEANATAIKTAVEKIDDMISGSEAQVDVVAPLPTGTNIVGTLKTLFEKYNEDGNCFGCYGSASLAAGGNRYDQLINPAGSGKTLRIKVLLVSTNAPNSVSQGVNIKKDATLTGGTSKTIVNLRVGSAVISVCDYYQGRSVTSGGSILLTFNYTSLFVVPIDIMLEEGHNLAFQLYNNDSSARYVMESPFWIEE